MNHTLLILGAGGHGRSVAEAALASGEWSQIVFLDDSCTPGQMVLGWPVAGTLNATGDWRDRCQGAIAAVGNNGVREAWVGLISQAGIPLPSIIHPHSWISPSARIGEGCAIMAGAVVGALADVGRAAIVNSNATVDHDAVLGDFAHLGVGVQLAGGVVVGAKAWLQAGCICGYGANIEPGEVLTTRTAR